MSAIFSRVRYLIFNNDVDNMTKHYTARYYKHCCVSPNFRLSPLGSSAGKIALIEFARQKCHLVLHHPPAAVTSLDAHPER